jgi:3-dehydroquinate synthase
MVRVRVPAGDRSYEVVVGAEILADAEQLPDLAGAEAAFVVSDAQVAERYLPAIAAALEQRGLSVHHLAVPAGEPAKDLRVYEDLLHRLAGQEAHRSDVLVALGGGAVGDLTGFVASTYMRGMKVVQVPTTLVAQVDAAIGGKTAVNLPSGKNLVGTFFQPVGVLADVSVLQTLPDRAYRSGLAEVAKYGLVLDTDLLVQLESDPAPILARDLAVLEPMVARCVAIKAATVAQDERDTGVRLFLNYGHTLGHALERLDAFAGRTHGEAIAIGMVFAARLAEVRGSTELGLSDRTTGLLASLGLPTDDRLPPTEEIVAALRMDKKFHGSVRFVLLEDAGIPQIATDVDEAVIREVLEEMGATG